MLIRTGKNYIDSFLVILFCTFVILSTTGYSFAQQELQIQQPSTVTELPWSNNLPTFDTGNTQHRNTQIISSQTFVNSKNLDLLRNNRIHTCHIAGRNCGKMERGRAVGL